MASEAMESEVKWRSGVSSDDGWKIMTGLRFGGGSSDVMACGCNLTALAAAMTCSQGQLEYHAGYPNSYT